MSELNRSIFGLTVEVRAPDLRMILPLKVCSKEQHKNVVEVLRSGCCVYNDVPGVEYYFIGNYYDEVTSSMQEIEFPVFRLTTGLTPQRVAYVPGLLLDVL